MQLNGIVQNALKMGVFTAKICLGVPKNRCFFEQNQQLLEKHFSKFELFTLYNVLTNIERLFLMVDFNLY